jgi:uncharacterized protein YbjT (DUF2867 family)
MEEKTVLIAGATGYLGQYLVKESKNQGYWVRALTRDSRKLAHLSEYIDDIFVGEITDPNSMSEICKDIDYVISAVGITRQKDGLSYMDVDYQGNRNLLDIALNGDVSRFAYVSALNADVLLDLKIAEAKERFVRDLEESSFDYVILRPSGFFPDMLDFLRMAKKSRVYLFGVGEYRINPVHGQDLAEVCVAALTKPEKVIEVGGPETLTHKQIAEIAFEVLHKKAKISCLPLWLVGTIVRLLRLFTSSKTYGPIEFMMSAFTMDMVAPACGKEKLRDFFEANAESG